MTATVFLAVGLGADEVVLQNGESVYGQVLRDTEALVVVLVPTGIRALRRDEVARIDAGKEAPTPAPAARAQPTPPRRRAVVRRRKVNARDLILEGNRKVELVVAGNLGGVDLAAGDPSTRSRAEYFLAQQCKPPLELASGGADLRMTITASTRFGRSVTFYGVELGRNVNCHLQFKLERVTEGGVQLLAQGGIDSGLMGKSESPALLGRRAFDVAVYRLFLQLGTLALFGAENGQGTGS